MACDRKDLRVYFEPTVHADLLVLAEIDQLEPSKLAELAVAQYVYDRVHAATLIAQRTAAAGVTRLRPVLPGSTRVSPDLSSPRHAGGKTAR